MQQEELYESRGKAQLRRRAGCHISRFLIFGPPLNKSWGLRNVILVQED
jgi:hypothetical protein